MVKKVFLTKKLPKQLLDSYTKHFSFMQHDFITISLLKVNATFKGIYIILSQNSIKSLIQNNSLFFQNKTAICVGYKTKLLLESYKCTVLYWFEDAYDLINKMDFSQDKNWVYCHGSYIRNELTQKIKSLDKKVTFLKCYETIYNSKHIKNIDTVNIFLFFSSSAVSSFFMKNKLNSKQKSIAIGYSTAKTLKEYTHNVSISKNSTFKECLATLNKSITQQIIY